MAYSWALGLLALPVLVRWLTQVYQTPRDALQAPFFQRLIEASGRQPDDGRAVMRRTLAQKLMISLFWLCIVAALTRPQWIGEPIVETLPARDLMVAVDLSGSMETEDFVSPSGDLLNRLDGLKLVLDEFVLRREHDRLGLVVFGSAPYLQTPFTLDRDLFHTLLHETRVRMAGPKTMLGDAIGLSVNHFNSSDTPKKVLVLVTDGNDTGSMVPPRQAAEVALDGDITIHVIAIGDPAAVGEEALDIEAMESIAKITGGQYFHAADGEQLNQIYEALDELEPNEQQVISHRPRTELYYWPLGLGLGACLGLHLYLALTSLARRPGSLLKSQVSQ
jgi:Ca-activated chloride channel family protein